MTRARLSINLACYLFETIPGLSISQRNVKNASAPGEIDIAFWNEHHPSGLRSIEFGSVILVECKNWSKPVGSLEVSWFLAKLQNRARNFGVLIAASGITCYVGERREMHDIVSKALARGIEMIVLTRTEIEAPAGHGRVGEAH